MTEKAELPAGLRRAYIEVLFPVALLAPLPLFWTLGAAPFALMLYEVSLLLLAWRARAGRPVRLPDAALNAIGLSYFLWLGFEVVVLRPGLLRAVSHLLLFTAIAKLASLKRPGEARTAMLVLFLLTLASASSSTHVASLLYFAAMAFLGFRALARLAVLADFDDAPPARVLRAIPTRGLAAAALVTAVAVGAPLFYALPRLRAPYASIRLRLEDPLSTALTADRVELESFGAAKRSDRVILRMRVEPRAALSRVLYLREAVFTDYSGGVWTRRPASRGPGQSSARSGRDDVLASPAARRPGQPLAGTVEIDLNIAANGFLFLPYGASGLEVGRGVPWPLSDGVVRLTSSVRSVRYTTGVLPAGPRAPGSSAIAPASVPAEIRAYGERLTEGLTDPLAIFTRIREHFAKDFLYTLDVPRASGDPLVGFLTRSRAGHCEFFASAAAMMLTSRGIPARLVTGSYGGEIGFLSGDLIVRGTNLHSWVEADLDGRGFVLLDPTPPAGVPLPTTRVSWWRRLVGVGREIEFFYDRRILGFDSLDQAQVLDAARQSLGGAATALDGWRRAWAEKRASVSRFLGGLLLVGAILLLGMRRLRRQAAVPVATKAYLKLRRLVAQRKGALSPAVAPAEVVRLFSEMSPEGTQDARAIVTVYCASAFGGREPDPATARQLAVRVKRLKKLA